MNWGLASLCLVSCAIVVSPRADCVTPCGLRLAKGFENVDAGWSCADLEAAERHGLEVLRNRTNSAEVPDGRLLNACAAWNGWLVITRPETTWLDHGQPIAGRTHCDRGPQLIETSSGVPARVSTGLLHELVHAAQDCWAGVAVDSGETAAHANWVRAGIRQALDDVGQQ